MIKLEWSLADYERLEELSAKAQENRISAEEQAALNELVYRAVVRGNSLE